MNVVTEITVSRFLCNAPPLDFRTSKKKKKQKIFKTYTNASDGAYKTCDRDKYINYFSIRKHDWRKQWHDTF